MWKAFVIGLAGLAALTASLWLLAGPKTASGIDLELLNVSYDPTRELWRDLNSKFIPIFEQEAGVRLTIKQSHGGSATQARAVIDGLDADVVTLALASDTDAIRKKGLIADGWQQHLPNDSLPYFSTLYLWSAREILTRSKIGPTSSDPASAS
jgi:sulfate transport system substrate-binding protein